MNTVSSGIAAVDRAPHITAAASSGSH